MDKENPTRYDIDPKVLKEIKDNRGLGGIPDDQARFVIEKNPAEETVPTIKDLESEPDIDIVDNE